MRGLTDRLGAVEDRDMKPRLLCEGRDRCGIDRGADWIDRLGICRLAWLLPLLREPRSVLWASATEASSNAVARAMAPAIITELDLFFVENIVDLLSPAACSSLPATRDSPSRIAAGTQHAL